jgi:DNA-binding phage protein
MLSGEITLAKTMLRDYINATLGFTGLAEATHIPPKSLMRMFSPAGNPRAANLFEIVSLLQHREGVRLHVRQNPR